MKPTRDEKQTKTSVKNEGKGRAIKRPNRKRGKGD
jgi:hypothetical protein